MCKMYEKNSKIRAKCTKNTVKLCFFVRNIKFVFHLRSKSKIINCY